MDAKVLLSTALFIEAAARHIAAEARRSAQIASLSGDEVTAAVRGLYEHAKLLKDRRARLLAPRVADNPTKGPTNVGDPAPKGMKGAKAK